MKPLTDEQRKCIFGLCRALGLDAELRKSKQELVVGKSSLKDFTVDDGMRLIKELKIEAGQSPAESGMAVSGPPVYRHPARGSGDGKRTRSARGRLSRYPVCTRS